MYAPRGISFLVLYHLTGPHPVGRSGSDRVSSMRRTARDWGRGYVPGTAPVECELYLCALTGAVGMYQARPPRQCQPGCPCPGPACETGRPVVQFEDGFAVTRVQVS
jgi:hypothetical protein